MKKLKLLLFLICSFAYGSHPSLVFVHLGNNIPSCIWTTMKQARYLNQNCDIYLLTDCPDFNNREFFTQERIALVDIHLLPMTPEHAAYREINQIDPALADGLWVFALERFFYLYDFIKDRSLENVFHLENDSMLYADLQELMPPLQQSDIRLAAPFQSAAACIPCFVFIKDAGSLLPLMDHILSVMRGCKGALPPSAINDMHMLASFYRKFGASSMAPLPTLMPEFRRPKRRSAFEPDNKTPLKFLSTNATLFPGYLFDAATLGVFANGNDKKFFPQSGPGAIHYRSLFDPRFFSFYWGTDPQGKPVPYISFDGKSYRIVNLHFHSKSAEEYTSYEASRKELPVRKVP